MLLNTTGAAPDLDFDLNVELYTGGDANPNFADIRAATVVRSYPQNTVPSRALFSDFGYQLYTMVPNEFALSNTTSRIPGSRADVMAVSLSDASANYPQPWRIRNLPLLKTVGDRAQQTAVYLNNIALPAMPDYEGFDLFFRASSVLVKICRLDLC